MSQSDTHINDPDPVETIALPTEIPKRIDVSKLPLQLLRSGSIEALIAQNEDLMARLTVTLRRLAMVEESNHQIQEQNHKLSHENECLTDQVLVRQKKDEFWKEKILKAESETEKAHAEIRLLETRYAELYSTSDLHIQNQEKVILELNRRVRRLEKYRNNAFDPIRRLKQAYRQIKDQYEQSLHALEQLKSAQQDYQNNIGELTEKYEISLVQSQAEIEELKTLNNDLLQKIVVFENLLQDQITLENRAIFAETRVRELEDQFSRESTRWTQSLESAGREKIQLQMQLKQVHRDYENNQSELTQQKEDNLKLREQVHSLQLLWDQSRKKIEQLTVQESALQRLNQELSTQLSEARREANLKIQAQEVASVQAFKSELSADLTWIERVEESLKEIETGFKR